MVLNSAELGHLAAVAVGGSLGAVARYVLAGFVQRTWPDFTPAGTLAVNVLGCLLIGVLMGLVVHREITSPAVRLFLITGFLGSMTTFSAFGYETVELLREREVRLAVLNMAANLVLGLAAVWMGLALTRRIM